MLSEHDQAIVDNAVEAFLTWGQAKDRNDNAEMARIIREQEGVMQQADDYAAVLVELAKRRHDPDLRKRRLADMERAGL